MCEFCNSKIGDVNEIITSILEHPKDPSRALLTASITLGLSERQRNNKVNDATLDLSIWAGADEDLIFESIPISYCPFCGENLTKRKEL